MTGHPPTGHPPTGHPPTSHPTEPVWGAPQTDPAHWSLEKTLAAVGIAVVLAAGGAAVIYAASGSTNQSGPGFGGPPGGGFGGPGGPSGGQDASTSAPASLHGEFVVADGRGGYTTELTQTGEVTDVSDASITVRSEDGFTATYVINTDTRQSRTPAKTGDTAKIRAVAGDGTETATVISAGE